MGILETVLSRTICFLISIGSCPKATWSLSSEFLGDFWQATEEKKETVEKTLRRFNLRFHCRHPLSLTFSNERLKSKQSFEEMEFVLKS
jgi:hypothetical protein